jgi:class 3 adenylate cyclase
VSAPTLSTTGSGTLVAPRAPAGSPAVERDARSIRASLWPLTLAFQDRDLERRFQLAMGRDGLMGYRLSCALGILLWLVAVVVVPVRPPADPALPMVVGLLGVLVNMGGEIGSRWTDTQDRQNAAATPIAIANGVGALLLASAAGVTETFAASSLVLIAVFFFVARVRFVFAAVRIVVLLAAFAVFATADREPRVLLLDVFILTAAMGGILIGLYRMELTLRRLFRSDQTLAAQSEALARENRQSQSLLLNILPAPVAGRLRAGEDTIADEVPDATVLFADLAGFTPLAHGMAAGELVQHLDELFTRFDALAERAGVEKIKTVGDAYMAAGGIPMPLPDHAARVVALGLAMIEAVADYGIAQGLPLALRVGVHTGPLVAGVIGTHKFQYDLWGDTVNVASRLETTGVAGAVQVSQTTRDRLDARFSVNRRGTVRLKGVGAFETWLVRPEGGRRGMPTTTFPKESVRAGA